MTDKEKERFVQCFKVLEPYEQLKELNRLIRNKGESDESLREKLTTLFASMDVYATNQCYKDAHGSKKELVELIIKHRWDETKVNVNRNVFGKRRHK